MVEPTILIGAIFALAMLHVLLSVVGETYARFRGPRPVRCPDCEMIAEVRLDGSARGQDGGVRPSRRCVPDVPGTEGAEPVPRVTAV